MASDGNSRIKFALHLPGWEVGGDKEFIEQHASRVIAADYTSEMDGHLFCPTCFTTLTRTPKEKLYFTNGRRACFAHLPRYSDIPCTKRTPAPEGLRFMTEELAMQAVERGDLVVVSSFMAAPPQLPEGQDDQFNQAQVEDLNGPIANLPLARHNGGIYRLPSKVATVVNLCRRFDRNLSRHYVLPGSSVARTLEELLVDARTVTEADHTPRLYFAKIRSSKNMGRSPSNVRMTWLEEHSTIADLCLKDTDGNQAMKGVGDESKGRTLLVWSTVVENGVGYAFANPGWGSYALLPVMYEPLIEALRSE